MCVIIINDKSICWWESEAGSGSSLAETTGKRSTASQYEF